MKTIAYVVPFFGKIPKYFQVWLDSCRYNPTIDWLVFTDDKTDYQYPSNVKVFYISFDEMRLMIQKIYDFPIWLKSAYKLVDFKVAYGEIFSEYLEQYDFWGFCDIDMIWGDIRSFFTDELLNNYSKIGCQGHSTIFKNDKRINAIYRIDLENEPTYKDIYSSPEIGCTDIGYIRKRFLYSNEAIYADTIYAGLMILKPAFFLQALPKSEDKFNKRQIFVWDNGKLTRYYLDKGELRSKEYLYIHFFKRPMKNKIKTMSLPIIIYPNCYKNFDGKVTAKLVNRLGKKNYLAFVVRMIWQNRHKLSLGKLKQFIQSQIKQ